MNKKFLKYSDVYLVPRHSSLPSRSQANVSVDFLGKTFKLPVVPANMIDVIDEDIAKILSENNYFYIMHRFFHKDNEAKNVEEIYNFVNKSYDEKWKTISISIGVTDAYIELLKQLAKLCKCPHYITIDVAHADHENVKPIINYIKKQMFEVNLIVGNVCTPEGCDYLINLGADAIKIGVGGGSICSTANKTGFHVPMFSCCLHCQPICEKYNIPFIADGGIREFGDISKALVGGARMVMCGSLFAECIDSPAEIINGFKQYRGSTSFEVKGKPEYIEGKKIEIRHNVKYKERLEEIKQALSSAISYAGGTDLNAFNLVNYILV